MSGIQSTPVVLRASNNPVNLQGTRIGDPDVLEGWKKELRGKLNLSEDTGSEFLETYVPSSTPCTCADVSGKEFDDFKPVKGGEVETYASFIEGLNALVASFPDQKKLSFFDCHTQFQRFPYADFSSNHHKSYPDIAVSFPGQILDAETSHLDWSRFSMIVELKAENEDPFRGKGLKYCKTLVQLAVNARNLLHAHSLLAAFVVGVYGDTVRIARFDHAGAIFSQPLSLGEVDDLRIIQRFFWNFAHPNDGETVVGCDPTVRRLTPDDEEWLKHRLELAGVSSEGLLSSEARRAEVFNDDVSGNAGVSAAYILFKALDVNGRLFSRATTVWLGIRDTRSLVNGRLVDLFVDRIPAEDLKVRIVKDAWRQVVRRSEKDFYARLSRVPSTEHVGVPSLVFGGDLGEREVRQWESHLYGAPVPDHQSRLSGPVSNIASSSIPPPSLSPRLACDQFPAHRPMQQTFTWRQSRGSEYWHRERSHMRFVVDKVGRPLIKFRNTREMTAAIRDAIRGHRVAMTRAGILHRDVSVNNILIVDDPAEQDSFIGFIHDFDYSSMSREFPAANIASLSAAALSELLLGDDDGGELKERTGTFYFMAIQLLGDEGDIHGLHHDLQSFYWVILWVVLRHTDHTHPKGDEACPHIFDPGERASLAAKYSWLSGRLRKDLRVRDNVPLTVLLKEFGDLCVQKLLSDDQPLDYDEVLAIFDKVLDSDGYRNLWPAKDAPKAYKLPDTRIKDELSSGQRRAHQRHGASKRKREGEKARRTGSDSETDMDDETKDFEPYDEISEDRRVRMHGRKGNANFIGAPNPARLIETNPSFTLCSPTRNYDVSLIEADQVEAILDYSDSEDQPDDAPDSSPFQEAKRRKTAVSGTRVSASSTKAATTLVGTSGSTLAKRVSMRELHSLGHSAVNVESWRGPASNTRSVGGGAAGPSRMQPGRNERSIPQASSNARAGRARGARGRQRSGKEKAMRTE
ncbi:hypothetical protein DICSQDRAFT_172310 [Dichomitus squalens LYAD-421 SS1]|uniref:Fungal-type protein kinase domain-containing protein n=1 Tax=Dichomitus squalens (strain LYAD-421) TaxID=732165 RepID=R7SW40_DICSQ|nr:uncharacterized protein DICSQDRAFT_172310 [Dichomitus squalens LYAD-421 SS1]EJF59157.1 hypothetical protein DICSQDRAFT_172310 [Dichomitus squalens LYAD-421 SS1]